MQLKRLYIKDYKILKNFTIDFPFDSKKYISVFIGANGSGKSTILEAVAEIFSSVLNVEKSKFGFELEYTLKNASESINTQSKDFIIRLFSDDKSKPIQAIVLDDNANVRYNSGIIKKGELSIDGKPFSFVPDYIVIYYSGLSEIMQELSKPHEEKLSEAYRKGNINIAGSFFYHKPEHFNIILLSLLSYEFGDIPDFLREKAKIEGIQNVQIKLKEPYWAESGSVINDFWGATGKVKRFLDFVCHDYSSVGQKYDFLDYDLIKSNIVVEENNYDSLVINIIGHNTLYAIKEFLGEERSLFDVLRTMYYDDLLEKIQITLIKNENDVLIPFNILSEGEQQAITIRGLTELLGTENTLFLFDEPDTYLHPKWQRDFIKEIESNIEVQHQNELNFVIATHSPQILSNANPEKTYVKIIEDGQLVEQTPKHYGREISSILYNLMGVEERNETIRKELSNLFMLIEDEEIEEAERELKRLTEILGETDADIQNAVIQLNYLKEDEKN